MFTVFEASTADTLFAKVVAALLDGKSASVQQSRLGPTKELQHACLCLSDSRRRWITTRRPAMNPAFALAEVIWIMNGRDDARFLNFFNSQLPRFAGGGAAYHGAYGRRLRSHFGLDQLRRASSALRANPDSRQVVLQIWDPRGDLPRRNGSPSAKDIPCNVCSLLKVREGALEWTQIIRSNDVLLGLPHNLVQFTALQEVLAGWMGVEPGSYHQLSDSLHAYLSDLKSLDADPARPRLLACEPLALQENESLRVFRELAARMDVMLDLRTTSKRLQRLASWRSAPQGYQDMLFVIAAETARRRGWPDVSSQMMTGCSSPVYTLLWKNWLARLSSHPTRKAG